MILPVRHGSSPSSSKRRLLRAFHDVVLADGAMPLPMLRAKVRRWIAGRRAA